MKALNKPDKKEIKKINEYYKKNSSYGYYCNTPDNAIERLNHHRGINCSDIDTVEEQIEEHRKEYFKKHICRKATPEELEWIRKQPKVDLDAPEHEHLKPILTKLIEEGWFE